MRTTITLAAGLLFAVPVAPAQPSGRGGAAREDAAGFVARMMAFDKNKDGKLTRDEITDDRLLRLFDRADANKDGVATREELTALFERENQGGGGFDGPGGFGGPGGRGPGGPPRPGQVLPEFLQEQVNLSDVQKKEIADLQKEVDARLDRILTADQKARLREMRDRGPGGPGGRRGGPPPER
ncbi:MAG TPA: hypothetical protein VGF55_18170 [Gemmataceae bacterium]|jgi:hypothetical protein